MAGEYPGTVYDEDPRAKVRWLLEAGVSAFVDLTEEGELEPYLNILGEEAARVGIAPDYQRWSIPDMKIPSKRAMTEVLEAIDAKVDAGNTVYLHCLAGLGRTGAVVGCYLVRHGLSGPEALEEIMRLRVDIPGSPTTSPYTQAQRDMVLAWSR